MAAPWRGITDQLPTGQCDVERERIAAELRLKLGLRANVSLN